MLSEYTSAHSNLCDDNDIISVQHPAVLITRISNHSYVIITYNNNKYDTDC